MSKTIFHRENSVTEEWLQANDDGTFTHRVENSGWKLMRKGLEDREARYTLADAIAKWPSHRPELEAAVREATR